MKLFGTLHMALYRAKRAATGVAGQCLSPAATVYRHCLPRTAFVVVTGSRGKSTTTRLIGHLLSPLGTGHVSGFGSKSPFNTALAVLTLKPWSRYCVREVSGHGPGVLDPVLRVLRPQIAVVTNVADDHIRDHGSQDAIAREKRKVVECLPSEGVAVLNGDDPRVSAMAAKTAARVVTYGLSEDVDIRASDVRSAWPDRLSMVIHHEGRSVAVRTQLVGTQWAYAILGAMAAAKSCGLSLRDCAERVATFEAIGGRMEPIRLDDDITFIHDAYKGAHSTVPPFLSMVRSARARRKIVVLGDFFNFAGDPEKAYAEAIREALANADLVYFVGPDTVILDDFDPGEGRDRYRVFRATHDLNDHLHELLQPGDVVFLKGRRHTNHLERLFLDRTEGIVCWREKCDITTDCPNCRGWRVPSYSDDHVIGGL
jgi:UDP-N-acetylmuramoyl-tripeptide--D-alanyl-D-alanine ligase